MHTHTHGPSPGAFLFAMEMSLLDETRLPQYRLKYEYCVVLRCVAASGVLSRFLAEGDKRLAEGRERTEEVIAVLRSAGLTLKMKKHQAKDGSKYVFVFVGANRRRLEHEASKVSIERWLQEEGIGALQSRAREGSMPQGSHASKPTMRVVRVGGLHYLAPHDGDVQPPTSTGPAASSTAAGTSTPTRTATEAPTSAETPGGGVASPQSGPGGGSRLSSATRVELLEHILYSPRSQGGAGFKELRQADRRGTIVHVFPLHDHRYNRRLRRRARYLNPFFGPSRELLLDGVRSQFGERAAFYFAFNCTRPPSRQAVRGAS